MATPTTPYAMSDEQHEEVIAHLIDFIKRR